MAQSCYKGASECTGCMRCQSDDEEPPSCTVIKKIGGKRKMKIEITISKKLEDVLNRLISVLEVSAGALSAAAPDSEVKAEENKEVVAGNVFVDGKVTKEDAEVIATAVNNAINTSSNVVQSAPIVPIINDVPKAGLPFETLSATQVMSNTVPVSTAVPTAQVSYDINQLALAATQLVDAGRREEVVGLLGEFGVRSMTELPTNHYGIFATKLRALGAKI